MLFRSNMNATTVRTRCSTSPVQAPRPGPRRPLGAVASRPIIHLPNAPCVFPMRPSRQAARREIRTWTRLCGSSVGLVLLAHVAPAIGRLSVCLDLILVYLTGARLAPMLELLPICFLRKIDCRRDFVSTTNSAMCRMFKRGGTSVFSVAVAADP